MANTEEGSFKVADGKELYTKTWKPTGEPTAALVFLHGFSDHANRYNVFFASLNEAGIIVYSFDQRGWGRTVKKPGEKGLTGPTAQVMDDITAFLKSHLPSPVPLFMMGHSMGGQETLYFMATAAEELKKQISGYILSAPFIGFPPSSEPGWLKVTAGKLVGKLLPSRQLVSKLDPSLMSHDAAWNKGWADDELCHDTGTLEGLAGMLDRVDDLNKDGVVIKDWQGLHVLFLHGTEDMVTSHEATKSFVGRLNVKNKELKLYQGAFHCISAEPDHKDKFQADIIEFIKARTEAQQGRDSALSEGQSKL